MKITSKDIANFLKKDFFGENIVIEYIKPIDNFENNSMSFSTKKLTEKNTKTKGFLILSKESDLPNIKSFSYLLSENPRLDFARVVKKFFSNDSPINLTELSYVDPSSKLGANISIGQGCYIGKNVSIGDGTIIRNNVTIMESVKIGKECYIKSGTVVGEKGFGFEFEEDMTPVTIPHIGGVEIIM